MGTESTAREMAAERVGDYSIALLVAIVQRLVDDTVMASLQDAGFGDLTRAHGLVFTMLDPGGSRVTSMARRARMTKQGMGQLVAAVEQLGYVERVADPDDGRAHVVQLTPRGKRAVAAVRRGSASLEGEWNRLLGDRRYRSTRKALVELVIATGLDHVR